MHLHQERFNYRNLNILIRTPKGTKQLEDKTLKNNFWAFEDFPLSCVLTIHIFIVSLLLLLSDESHVIYS